MTGRGMACDASASLSTCCGNDTQPWSAPVVLQRDTVEGLASKLLGELPGQVRKDGRAAGGIGHHW